MSKRADISDFPRRAQQAKRGLVFRLWRITFHKLHRSFSYVYTFNVHVFSVYSCASGDTRLYTTRALYISSAAPPDATATHII